MRLLEFPKPDQRTDQQHVIDWLRKKADQIASGEINPHGAVLILTEQAGDINRLYHYICNLGVVEGIGYVTMAAHDMVAEPPEVDMNTSA